MMFVIAGLYLERRDPRMRVILTIALFMMIFIHHHSAVLTFLFFTFAISGDAILSKKNAEWSWHNNLDFITAAIVWVLCGLYYQGIDLPYYQFLSPEQDLYLFIAIMGAMVVLMFITLSRTGQGMNRPYLKTVIPVAGIGLLLVNYFHPIFPGIPATEQSVFVFASAYLVLMIPVWVGADKIVRSKNEWRPMLLSLLFAPMSMILFAFLRGLDVMSYTIIARTFDFLDLAFAALFGMGIVLLFHLYKRASPIIPAVFLVALLATAPLAFQTEEAFNVHNQTYEHEYDAFEALAGLSPERAMDSDQRLGTSAKSLFNFSGGTDLAIRIETGESLEEFHWLVFKTSWADSGAQQFPFGQFIISEANLSAFLAEANILLVSGPVDNQLMVALNLD